MSLEQSYIELYSSHRDEFMSTAPEAMNVLRSEAIRTFESQGFPSRKVEEYRYIDVRKAFEGDYAFSVYPADILCKDAPVTVNNADLLAAYYAKCADNSDSITALNTAFANECLCVHVLKNQIIDKPIELTDVLMSDKDLMEHKRILIVLEEGASVTMLFHYVAKDKVKFLTTQVIEVFVGDNAHLDMYELEETHSDCTEFNNVYFNVGRNATVKHNNITLFNGLTRNTIKVVMAGEYSDVVLNGCAMTDKHQIVDNNTLIRHEAPNCSSSELYKYVVDEQSVGAFTGKVYVAKGAQNTNSNEVNQNICASDEARMYTQPMLEIYADDVKCSHGSTVGKLDDMALFYMRQRGISLADARMLLMQAFINQVVDTIPLVPLRNRLNIMVEQRFKGELDKCVGCAFCK